MRNSKRVVQNQDARRHGCQPSERGSTLVETAAMCLILGIVTGMAVIIITSILPTLHADSSLDIAVGELRQARESAMDQRQNFTVTFTAPNEIAINPVPSGLPAVNFLGQGVILSVLPGIPDTPDQFDASSTPVCFEVAGGPCATSITFQGDGTAENAAGQLMNGTVFMATPGLTNTARAVTVMGTTGHIQGYRYNGSTWTTQ
jgi:Tfp pilus assembly protein FimT